MEYHQHNHHQHHAQFNHNGPHGLSLPDSSTSSSEKALMWSNTQYMTESGYSTQAPSISSIDAFLNNDQMDTTINNNQMETGVNLQQVQVQPPQQQQQQAPAPQQAPTSEWNLQQQQQQQQQFYQPATVIKQETTTTAAAAEASDDNNAVANWINYQDNSEMALKAIPELLKLLIDEDLVVVQQAAILLNQMSRTEAPRLALIQTPHAVKCLVDCLITTADLETARSLVGALYGVSTQKPLGVNAIAESKALEPLVKMLSAPMETIVSYSITTLHNVLLGCNDSVKQNLRKMGAIHQMIPLLSLNQNVKFLSIVVDCIQLLAFGNKEAKQIIHDLGGTDAIVNLLANNHQYQKLLLNITRLLKVLSVCVINKPKLVSLNAMQTLSAHLINKVAGNTSSNQQTTHDITQNCLITLRNLSDAATRINGLEQLIQNLLQLLSTSNDYSMNILAAGILSNLTCNNENNKKAAVKSNGIKILLKLIETNMLIQKPLLVEPLICALRHITNRHSDMLLAQEQFRLSNGINLITQLMSIQPRLWSCIKAALGLIRNLCTNQLNSNELRSNCIIEKLMQVLYDAYTEIQVRSGPNLANTQLVKLDDVNLFDIVDASSSALLLLAKEYQNQIIMKDLDCIGFFVQMFYSPNILIQKAASSLLAELSSSKECSEVIEQQAGLNQFVQINFCNQFGQLKTISEIAGGNNSNSNMSIVLQHVTTLMQRLQEHRNQRAFMIQQQQAQQQQQQQRSNPYHQTYQQPMASQQMPPMDQYGMPMHQQQMAPAHYPANMQPVYNQQFQPQQYY